jgi:hypothetical protein
MRRPTGLTFYEGPSLIDGGPIVVLMTLQPSRNPKLGKMLQCWIMRSDMAPVEALDEGLDKSVCGDCKHRKHKEGQDFKGSGSCYLNLNEAPAGIYGAYKNGKYVPFSSKHIRYIHNRKIRIGSYGDPSAVPLEVWEKICKYGKGSTGYTHQWKSSTQLQHLVMASVDTLDEKRKAENEGWRTFRILLPKKYLITPKLTKQMGVLDSNEITCPATVEGPKSPTCLKCGLCSGKRENETRKNITVVVHGSWKISRFFKMIKAIIYKRRQPVYA